MTNGTRRGWGVSVMRQPLFTPGKDPVTIVQEAGWARRPVWTGAENLAPPPRFDPQTVQPVASRYTDWATRPTSVLKTSTINADTVTIKFPQNITCNIWEIQKDMWNNHLLYLTHFLVLAGSLLPRHEKKNSTVEWHKLTSPYWANILNISS